MLPQKKILIQEIQIDGSDSPSEISDSSKKDPISKGQDADSPNIAWKDDIAIEKNKNLKLCGIECTEGFYQNQIKQHLNSLSPQETSTKKASMLKILKKARENQNDLDLALNPDSEYSKSFLEDVLSDSLSEEESDDDMDEIFHRFEGIDLDSLSVNEIWEILPSKLQKQFESLVNPKHNTADEVLKSVKISSLVPFLNPWWLCAESDVLECDKCPDFVEVPRIQLPERISPVVGISLLASLFSYCFTYRIFAGDLFFSSKKDIASNRPSNLIPEIILQLASVLYPPSHKSHIQFSTIDELFFDSIQKKSQILEIATQPRAAFLLGWEDVLKIIKPAPQLIQDLNLESDSLDFVSIALSQIYLIFDSQLGLNKSQNKVYTASKRKIAFLAEYYKSSHSKVFLSSFTQSHLQDLINRAESIL